MKWCSVKKYKPPNDEFLSPILVRTISNEYGSVKIMLAEYDGKWMEWENKDPIEETSEHDGWNRTVTHFCMLEPVEIEE
jgi:hypothetical protein